MFSDALEWASKRFVPKIVLSFWLAFMATILSAIATLPFEGAIVCHILAIIFIWTTRYEAKREGRHG